MSNSKIIELLALAGEKATRPLSQAYRRAARAGITWGASVADLVAARRSLTELNGIGPFLEKKLIEWVQRSPKVGLPPPIRKNFLTLVEAREILGTDGHGPVRGDLQMHTNWSDGQHTVAQMAEAAQARGYQFIAITDHAKGLKIAGGIDEDELQEQRQEIEEVNRKAARQKQNFRVLRSVELNLDPHGQGDLAGDALEQLDLVIGAFHSALRRTEDQTDRYLAALRNPHVHILAHPRGRIYNYRPGLTAKWERVFDRAAELNKAVEIDCYPDRQDLDVELLLKAKHSGVHISLGTDAHHDWQLAFIELGLAALRLVGMPRDRVLNFKSREQLTQWVRAH